MNERWKIARDSSTKTSGGIKAGEKVTITCTVTAIEIESSLRLPLLFFAAPQRSAFARHGLK